MGGAGRSWRFPVVGPGWGEQTVPGERTSAGSGDPRGVRGQGCGDGRVLVLILALVLLPHSHALSRENFGLCFWSPLERVAG